MSARPAGSTQRLPAATVFLFGAGSLGTGIYSALPGVLLLFFLTDTLGVAPALASMAIVVPKLWSIACDPIVGRRSDLHQKRHGTRAPFLLAGALGCAMTFAGLFAVPSALVGTAALWYVMSVYVLAVTAYSVYSVPYVTLPAEMSGDPLERTRIVAVRMGFMFLGALVGSAAAPAMVEAFGGGRAGYASMAFVLAGLAGASAMVAWVVGRQLPRLVTAPDDTGRAAGVQPESWTAPLRCRPFMALLAAYVCIAAAIATLTAGMPYFVRHVMRDDESRLAIFFVVFVAASLAGLPLWTRVAAGLGKGRALIASALLLAAACMLLATLPTGTGFMAVAFAAGLAVGGLQLLPFALLTDHVRGELSEAGAYTGIWTAMEKAGLAAGPLVVGALLASGDFRASPGAPGLVQPEAAIVSIKLAVSVAPAFLLGAGMLLHVLSRRGSGSSAPSRL